MANHTKLSAKQILFCQEYLIDMNATQACIRAGYSKGSANGQGARMLSNASVKAYVKELTDKRADKLDITADRILEELAHTAFFDIRNIFDNNVLKETDQLDDKTARALNSIKVRREKGDGDNYDEVIEVKSNDKLKALDMLSKHIGLYERDNEQSKTKVEVKSGVGELYKVINE